MHLPPIQDSLYSGILKSEFFQHGVAHFLGCVHVRIVEAHSLLDQEPEHLLVRGKIHWSAFRDPVSQGFQFLAYPLKLTTGSITVNPNTSSPHPVQNVHERELHPAVQVEKVLIHSSG
jgi:hypothetical protein